MQFCPDVGNQWSFLNAGASAVPPARVGTGQIWLDNVNCRGAEMRLSDCPSNLLGAHNCAHFEDAGVRCEDTGKCHEC